MIRDQLNKLKTVTAQGNTTQEKRGPEHSPEETIRRMESFPDRKGKLAEMLRAIREADSN
jgi:DNA polymerase II large subunit